MGWKGKCRDHDDQADGGKETPDIPINEQCHQSFHIKTEPVTVGADATVQYAEIQDIFGIVLVMDEALHWP